MKLHLGPLLALLLTLVFVVAAPVNWWLKVLLLIYVLDHDKAIVGEK